MNKISENVRKKESDKASFLTITNSIFQYFALMWPQPVNIRRNEFVSWTHNHNYYFVLYVFSGFNLGGKFQIIPIFKRNQRFWMEYYYYANNRIMEQNEVNSYKIGHLTILSFLQTFILDTLLTWYNLMVSYIFTNFSWVD